MPRQFKVNKCLIPTIYCGDKRNMPDKDKDNKYVRKGTRAQCLKKGVGAGIHIEKNDKLPKTSLQNIRFIGKYYEARFKKQKIKTLKDLIREAKKLDNREIEDLLSKICKNKSKKIDKRAFNSVILFLYRKGIHWVPNCKQIKSDAV
jgi:hypothetical protein